MQSELEAILKAGEERDGARRFMPKSAAEIAQLDELARLRAALRVAFKRGSREAWAAGEHHSQGDDSEVAFQAAVLAALKGEG